MTRVVVVDDQELVRTGFAMILEKAGLEVVGHAADGEQGVAVALEHRPDVVLMDVRMPGVDGIEATRRITAAPDAPRVLVLDDVRPRRARVRGRRGRCVGLPAQGRGARRPGARRTRGGAGEAMLAPALIRRLLERFARPSSGASATVVHLSERESGVARLVARGRSNAEIAAELFLSEATVKTYVSRLLTKLDLRDRVQIAVWAYESGLVRVGGEG